MISSIILYINNKSIKEIPQNKSHCYKVKQQSIIAKKISEIILWIYILKIIIKMLRQNKFKES